MHASFYKQFEELCGQPATPSFHDLPLELRIRCLENCDWRTLSRVACASRATRALVRYLVRAPYWRTLAERQPPVLCTDFATAEEREAACTNWAQGVTAKLCGRGVPNICFLFVSSRSHDNLPFMLRALRAHMAECTLLAGVVAPGVLGRDTETGFVREVGEANEAGLVLSVVHLPPSSELHVAYTQDSLLPPRLGSDFQGPQGKLPRTLSSHHRGWLVFSDSHAQVDTMLQELSHMYPGEKLCGGMGGSSDGTPSLIVGLPGRGPSDPLHAELTTGSLVVCVSGPGVECSPLAARGMRLISPRYMVSRVAPNVDLQPVGRVALVQELQNATPLCTRNDKVTWLPVGAGFTPMSALVSALQVQGPNVAPRAPLFFGVLQPTGTKADADPQRMTMLQMHDPNNMMHTSGYVGVQHSLHSGMVAAFYTPQPPLSRAQLESQLGMLRSKLHVDGLLASARNGALLEEEGDQSGHGSAPLPDATHNAIYNILHGTPEPVCGALLFPCVAKGQGYYGEPNVESATTAAYLPNTTLAGFFCNGEIGPTPPDELSLTDGSSARMMGYSTVLSFFKLTPDPEPPAEWLQW